MTSFRERLTSYVCANFPAIAVQSSEESRVLTECIEAARAAKRGFAVWSITEGLSFADADAVAKAKLGTTPKLAEIGDETKEPDALCEMARVGEAKAIQDVVLVLRDFQLLPLDREPRLGRAFHDLVVGGPNVSRTMILLGATWTSPPNVEKSITVLDFDLPDADALGKTLAKCVKANEIKVNGNADDLIAALSGLSTTEAENALALSLVETGGFTPSVIYREKVTAVKRSGLLEIIAPDPRGLDAVGGFADFKGWVKLRKRAFTKEAVAYGLPPPKGVLVCGVPGTGKSLVAKAMGTAMGIPIVRLDIGQLFGSLVGESERKTREALALAEAVAPCVLFCDEIEKGLAGSSGSGANDSGVTKRLLGAILTWLQDRKRPVFMVATANDVTSLPPELYRCGRWDVIWSVDLPDADERLEILRVVLAKKGRGHVVVSGTSDDAALSALDNFTGAEIEAAVDNALYAAFYDGARELTVADIGEAAKAIVPLSKMAKARVDEIRAWSQKNARLVSGPKAKADGDEGRKVTITKAN